MSPLVLFFSHHLQVSGDELGLLGGVLLLRTSPACGRTHPGTAQYTEGHTLCWSTCLQLQALILTSGIRYGCYMMLCWFCYVLFIFSPWISLIFPKIYLVYFNWWMHCCWNGLNVEYVEWPPTESLARICWPKATKITLNSSIHHCIGTHQTIHAHAICQPCSDFGRHLHVEVSNKMEKMDENRGAAAAVVDL